MIHSQTIDHFVSLPCEIVELLKTILKNKEHDNIT